MIETYKRVTVRHTAMTSLTVGQLRELVRGADELGIPDEAPLETEESGGYAAVFVRLVERNHEGNSSD